MAISSPFHPFFRCHVSPIPALAFLSFALSDLQASEGSSKLFFIVVSGPCQPISTAHGLTPVVDHSMREAEELCRRVVKRKEDHLGASHPETLGSVWGLAKLLEAKGSFAEAETFQPGSPLLPALLEGAVNVGS